VDTRVQTRPTLGVMLFSRREEPSPFTDQDVTLLKGIAGHLAQAISRTQEQEAHALEGTFISQVVTMEPGNWKEGWQHRLREYLEEIRQVLGADLVTVRAVSRGALDLVAHDPSEDELSQDWKSPPLQIPTLLYMGIGGSGKAAKTKGPVYIPRKDHDW